MLMRLVIYYYNGNEVIYKSEKLAMDIWNTDWYLRSNEDEKLIIIFLVRAQKPLKFDIGPFGALSLPAFLSVIGATYSYMMLFINTNK
uniref:Odorant receptor 21 n=1 Tax=Ips typographus TaxID=55986 RepID=M3UZF2_IPSTY